MSNPEITDLNFITVIGQRLVASNGKTLGGVLQSTAGPYKKKGNSGGPEMRTEKEGRPAL
tara:strand:+ start:222 stop:401 length:180 start_codon:yes stop_codon:yes gene_type:complete